MAWMQRSRPGDFGYRLNWRNFFNEVSNPSTKTDSNLKAPYQENKVNDLEYPSQSPSIFATCWPRHTVWYYPGGRKHRVYLLKQGVFLVCRLQNVSLHTVPFRTDCFILLKNVVIDEALAIPLILLDSFLWMEFNSF